MTLNPFRHLKRQIQRSIGELEARLHFQAPQALQNLVKDLAKNQALTPYFQPQSCEIDLNHFVLFEYSHHLQFGWQSKNLGDFVQTIATKNALAQLFPNAKFSYFNRDTMSHYGFDLKFAGGGGGIVVMQGWFSHTFDFLPSANALPVFVGSHFAPHAQDFIKHFYTHFPAYFEGKSIGCRDKFSLEFSQNSQKLTQIYSKFKQNPHKFTQIYPKGQKYLAPFGNAVALVLIS